MRTKTTVIITPCWGTLAAAPYSATDADGLTLTYLRIARVNATALAHGATEPDATTLLDVAVAGEIPEVAAGLAQIGDRVTVADGIWTTAADRRKGFDVPEIFTCPEEVHFPTITT